MTNTDLCREIARHDPEWFKILPGVAVKDPETGIRFRRVEQQWYDCDEDELVGWYGDNDTPQAQAVYRAVDAGPDWNDPVTVNALLGDGEVWTITTADGTYWYAKTTQCSTSSQARRDRDRTTAILLAKLASLGG